MAKLDAIVHLAKPPDYLTAALAARDAALWIGIQSEIPAEQIEPLATLMTLPWCVTICDSPDPDLAKALEKPQSDQNLLRARGYVYPIDVDPSEIEVPPKALPIYLANGRADAQETKRRPGANLAAQRRRLNALHELQGCRASHLVVVLDENGAPLDDLEQLWGQEGFCPRIFIVDPNSTNRPRLEGWVRTVQQIHAVDYLTISLPALAEQLTGGLRGQLPDGQLVVRVLGPDESTTDVDLTECELVEYPLLNRYDLILARDIRLLLPEDLTDAGMNAFFERTSSGWEAYAAGLPWDRSPKTRSAVITALDRMSQSSETPLLVIQSESGAGGTTLARTIGFAAAKAGYPTLVARDEPFLPTATEVRTFLDRTEKAISASGQEAVSQIPWLIAFDVDHWRGREDQLLVFHREIDRSGRRAVILAVVQRLEEDIRRVARVIDLLTHDITRDEAIALGKHLNRYLVRRGRAMSEEEWEQFWRRHTLDFAPGTRGSFWIGLEFWLRRQLPLGESIQSWLYRQYKHADIDDSVRAALLELAAMSSERLPLPDRLLPESAPSRSIAADLQTVRSTIPGLAMRYFGGSERQWYLAHDLIGRYLVAAAFHDWQMRAGIGLAEAQSPAHLRLLLLKRIASRRTLELKMFRDLAVEFAVNVFKLDIDRLEFAPYWHDLLEALDHMPQALRQGSRTFNHHTAITRRRIATMEQFFTPTWAERKQLLMRAAADLELALSLPPRPDDESDLNLYNSLALAYQNLVDVERELNTPINEIQQLMEKATRAAQRAEELDPRSSHVLETLARNLISMARLFPEAACERAAEALYYVFQAMSLDHAADRREALSRYADEALMLLRTPDARVEIERLIKARNPFGLLARAWLLLVGESRTELDLLSVPKGRLIEVLKILDATWDVTHPLVLRLRYAVTVALRPEDFERQLELLEELAGTSKNLPLQLKLEHAILLHQCHQHRLGSEAFRALRQDLQAETTAEFIEVPRRLFWLRGGDGQPRKCTATVIEGASGRGWARVAELQNQGVPFIPQDFGQKSMAPNQKFACFIRFGWKGPLITRPQQSEETR
jgi:hypothetical protein